MYLKEHANLDSSVAGATPLIATGGVVFLVSLCCANAAYHLSLVYSLNADSVKALMHPSWMAIQHSATARPLTAAIQWMLSALGCNIIKIQWITSAISIFLMAVATTVLQRVLVRQRRNSELLFQGVMLACSFTIVANPFVAEWFTNCYITPMYCLSELVIVLAAIRLARPSPFGWRDVPAILALTIIGASLFQSVVSLLLPLSLILLVIGGASMQTMLRRVLVGALAYAVSGIFDLLYVRLMHPLFTHIREPRTAHFDPMHSLAGIFNAQVARSIWLESFGMVRPYVFLGACMAALALALIAARSRPRAQVGAVAAVVLAIGMALSVHLATAVVWIVPRSVTTIASIPGLLVVPAIWFARERRLLFHAASLFAVAWMMICISASGRTILDYIDTDRRDLDQGRIMYHEISQYERESGVRVINVAFSLDREPVWCYPEAHCFGDMNVRAWTKPYARADMINLVSGRSFQEVPFPGTLKETFGVDNWNSFSTEQIHCVGNTAYIGIY